MLSSFRRRYSNLKVGWGGGLVVRVCQGLQQHIGPCSRLPVLSLWCEVRGSGKEKAEGNREVEFWERDQHLGSRKEQKFPGGGLEAAKSLLGGLLDRFSTTTSQHLTHN